MNDYAEVAALVREHQQRGGQPGLAYGIVRGGELVHAEGLGERRLAGPPPDADTVFRIASMTKSFTAAAVLILRDEGALALDDLAEEHVPELRGWQPVSKDAARVSIRHLLTMTAGFPTDDPWGDRQQGLPLEEFAKFLSGGVRFAWAPGTRFEYSNLGYAIVGRVITAVSGKPYPEFVRDRLLRPLGMTRTGYEAVETAELADLAAGYRRAPGGWQEVRLDPCGAFAPMGGLFTCVRDLAQWVAGFAAALPPADRTGLDLDAPGGHPLKTASRREMQLPQVLTGWDRPASFPAGEARSAYGFGLAVEDEPDVGRVVSHGGGYPGFGSYMRWHPATGTAVIALGNSTYARMGPLTARILTMLLHAGKSGECRVPLAPGQDPWPETITARDAVQRLLESWGDADAVTADRLFSPNVAQDVPYQERRNTIALIRERIGDFKRALRTPEYDSPAHCRWWLAGERGVVQAQILLTPERPPRVQSLTLAVPPAPGSALSEVTGAFVAWLNGGAAVPMRDEPQRDLLARRVRAAAAWMGECQPECYAAGDGVTAVTVELAGQHARMMLSLTVDPATDQLVAAEITLP